MFRRNARGWRTLNNAETTSCKLCGCAFASHRQTLTTRPARKRGRRQALHDDQCAGAVLNPAHTCPHMSSRASSLARLLPSPSHPLTSFPPFFSALVTIMPVISIATSRALCLHSSHVQHRCTGRTRCVFLRRLGATGLPATVEPLLRMSRSAEASPPTPAKPRHPLFVGLSH